MNVAFVTEQHNIRPQDSRALRTLGMILYKHFSRRALRLFLCKSSLVLFIDSKSEACRSVVPRLTAFCTALPLVYGAVYFVYLFFIEPRFCKVAIDIRCVHEGFLSEHESNPIADSCVTRVWFSILVEVERVPPKSYRYFGIFRKPALIGQFLVIDSHLQVYRVPCDVLVHWETRVGREPCPCCDHKIVRSEQAHGCPANPVFLANLPAGVHLRRQLPRGCCCSRLVGGPPPPLPHSPR
mmetsp:Transcript_24070/g.38839  ORF Transcript_24070/g.38839 Transcript_24070/m.38839 type:complete len:239 (+) Transcript_24070:860-1576(+)